jgi:hypothetical protein
MEPLLTSGGLSNGELSSTVAELAEKPLPELALANIPIAANFIDEDKKLLSTLVGISMDFDCSSDDN